MAAIGKVTMQWSGNDRIYTDESGMSFTLPGRPEGAPTLDLDPRIDLTKPIYEQVLKLAAKDKATAARAEKRKRASHAA